MTSADPNGPEESSERPALPYGGYVPADLQERIRRTRSFKLDTTRANTSYVPGAPAIRPTILGAAPNTPGFSEQDAADYVLHGHGVEEARGPISVGSVEFMAGATARSRLGIGTGGIADTRLLCVVELHGTFVYRTTPGETRPPRRTTVFWKIFDAVTGNLLIEAG